MGIRERQLTPIGRVDLSVDLTREGTHPIFWQIRRQVREAIQVWYEDRAKDVLKQPFQAVRLNEELRAKGISAAVLIGPGSHYWTCRALEDDPNYPLKIRFQPVDDASRFIGINFKTLPSVCQLSTDQRQARQIFSHRKDVAEGMTVETHFPMDTITATNLPITAEAEIPISSCIAVFLTPELAQKMGDTGLPPQFLLVTG